MRGIAGGAVVPNQAYCEGWYLNGMNGDLRIFSDAVAVLSNLDPPRRNGEFAVDRLALKAPGSGANAR